MSGSCRVPVSSSVADGGRAASRLTRTQMAFCWPPCSHWAGTVHRSNGNRGTGVDRRVGYRHTGECRRCRPASRADRRALQLELKMLTPRGRRCRLPPACRLSGLSARWRSGNCADSIPPAAHRCRVGGVDGRQPQRTREPVLGPVVKQAAFERSVALDGPVALESLHNELVPSRTRGEPAPSLLVRGGGATGVWDQRSAG